MPAPSPQLIRDEDESTILPETLKTWHVPAAVLAPGLALDFLLSLPTQPPPAIAFGASLRYWAEAAKFAIELITRQSFFPALLEEKNGTKFYRAAWPVYLSEADFTRLAGAQAVPVSRVVSKIGVFPVLPIEPVKPLHFTAQPDIAIAIFADSPKIFFIKTIGRIGLHGVMPELQRFEIQLEYAIGRTAGPNETGTINQHGHQTLAQVYWMPDNLGGLRVEKIELVGGSTGVTGNDPKLPIGIFIDAPYFIIVAETVRIIGIVLIARKRERGSVKPSGRSHGRTRVRLHKFIQPGLHGADPQSALAILKHRPNSSAADAMRIGSGDEMMRHMFRCEIEPQQPISVGAYPKVASFSQIILVNSGRAVPLKKLLMLATGTSVSRTGSNW